jgi:hypothetical protein
LEAGEYELHFATYNKDAATNRFVFQALLKAQTDGSVNELVTIQSGVTIAISSVVTGSL